MTFYTNFAGGESPQYENKARILIFDNVGFNRSIRGVKADGDMRLFQGPDPFVRFFEHLNCDSSTVTALLAHAVQKISSETSPKSPNFPTDPLQRVID